MKISSIVTSSHLKSVYIMASHTLKPTFDTYVPEILGVRLPVLPPSADVGQGAQVVPPRQLVAVTQTTTRQ